MTTETTLFPPDDPDFDVPPLEEPEPEPVVPVVPGAPTTSDGGDATSELAATGGSDLSGLALGGILLFLLGGLILVLRRRRVQA